MSLDHQETLSLLKHVWKIANGTESASLDSDVKLELIVTLIAVFMTTVGETRIDVDLPKNLSDSMLLLEDILEIVQHENLTASNDAERLFQIRLSVIQFLDNN